MEKWNLVIDVAKCENCNNCFLANSDEYVGNSFPGYAAGQPLHGHRWIDIKRKVRGSGIMVDSAYVPTMCNHCDDAPCIEAGAGVVKKRDDGIVIIDPEKSKGREDLIESCPYGAIWWNDELQIPQHWIFDAHLLDQGWKQPRGAHACPTEAMYALKVEDQEMVRQVEEQGLEVLEPELNTSPRVYYKNLHRYTKSFVGGSVVADINNQRECIQDAEISLEQNSKVVADTTSDMFGDFKFDHLVPDGGSYDISVTHPNHGKASLKVEVSESVYAGEILLSP